MSSSLSWMTLLVTVTVGTFILPGCTLPTGTDDEAGGGRKSYTGYKLLRTSSLDQPELANALMLSLDGKHGVHFWTLPKEHQTTDILASPRLYPHVKSLLDELGLEHDIVHDDIEKLIQEENVEAGEVLPESRQLAGHRMDWNNYHRYSGNY